MKIDEQSINHNAVKLIEELTNVNYDLIADGTDKDKHEVAVDVERAYILMTLGEIRGVIDMAKAMKEVLKA